MAKHPTQLVRYGDQRRRSALLSPGKVSRRVTWRGTAWVGQGGGDSCGAASALCGAGPSGGITITKASSSQAPTVTVTYSLPNSQDQNNNNQH